MSKRYIHLNDTNFPNVGDVNPYKYENNFDYSRWRGLVAIKLINVKWNSNYADVPKWDNDILRDEWFDDKEGIVRPLETLFNITPENTVKIPIPFNDAYNYNYLVVDMPMQTSESQPIAYEDKNIRIKRWYYFIDDMVQYSPNTTELKVTLDYWTMFINTVDIPYLMLERGHAPMVQTDVETFLNNPIENSEYLLANDFNYGNDTIIKHANYYPIGNGAKYVLFALPFTKVDFQNIVPGEQLGNSTPATFSDTSHIRWGYQYKVNGYEWNYGGYDYSNSKLPVKNAISNDGNLFNGVNVFAIEASSASNFFEIIASKYTYLMNAIQACFILADDMFSKNDSFSFEGYTIYSCVKRTDVENIVLNKNDFEFDEKYEDITKLYTFPYSVLEITDDNGNTFELKVENTSGNMTMRNEINIAYPYMNYNILFTGINGNGSQQYIWSEIAANKNKTIWDDDFSKFMMTWDIPTFSLFMSAENDFAVTNYTRMQAERNGAIVDYQNAVRYADVGYENTEDSLATQKTNAINIADVTKTNSYNAATTDKNNADRTANVSKQNADNQANTNKTNADNEANTVKQNADNQADTNKTNADNEANTNKENADNQANTTRDNADATSNTNKSNNDDISDVNKENTDRDADNSYEIERLNVKTRNEITSNNVNANDTITDINNRKLRNDAVVDNRNIGASMVGAVTNATIGAVSHGVGAAFNGAETLGGAYSGAIGAAGVPGAVVAGIAVAGLAAYSSLYTTSTDLEVMNTQADNNFNRAIYVAGGVYTDGTQSYGINNEIRDATNDCNMANNTATNRSAFYGWPEGSGGKSIADRNLETIKKDAEELNKTQLKNNEKTNNTELANNNRTENMQLANNENTQNMQLTNNENTQDMQLTNNENTQDMQLTNNENTQNMQLANNENTQNMQLTNNRNTESMLKTNADNSYSVDVANANRTYNTEEPNAKWNRDSAIEAAKWNLGQKQLEMDAVYKSSNLSSPIQKGIFTGDANPDLWERRGIRVNVRTQNKAAIAQTGDAMLRFGYALNRVWDMTAGFNYMKYFTYWKAEDVWINDGSGTAGDAVGIIQSILLAGVTIWKNPDQIGTISIYDNLEYSNE